MTKAEHDIQGQEVVITAYTCGGAMVQRTGKKSAPALLLFCDTDTGPAQAGSELSPNGSFSAAEMSLAGLTPVHSRERCVGQQLLSQLVTPWAALAKAKTSKGYRD